MLKPGTIHNIITNATTTVMMEVDRYNQTNIDDVSIYQTSKDNIEQSKMMRKGIESPLQFNNTNCKDIIQQSTMMTTISGS